MSKYILLVHGFGGKMVKELYRSEDDFEYCNKEIFVP